MENFWQDIRYGLRILVRNPGFAAAAAICLSLGIGRGKEFGLRMAWARRASMSSAWC